MDNRIVPQDKSLNDNPLMRDVVDACYEVYRHLGRFFVEKAYKLTLAAELEIRGHKVEVEEWIDIMYKGRIVEKAFRADLIVDSQLIVELKANDGLSPEHHAQLNTYLKYTQMPYGLLVNFHAHILKNQMSRKSLQQLLDYENQHRQKL